MEEQEKKYLYADKTEQNRRANKFLASGVTVYYIWILGLVWIAMLRGFRSLQFSLMITAIIVICSAGASILYARDSAGTKLKYIVSISVFIVSFLCLMHLTVIMSGLCRSCRLSGQLFILTESFLQSQRLHLEH